MLKGLYAAASGMIANLNRQIAITHNVDNMETPGFKQVIITMEDYINTTVVPPEELGNGPTMPAVLDNFKSNRLRAIGDLGLGVETRPEYVDFSQGDFMLTNQPLDLAIQGNGFFRVKTPDGERYTRDGRFVRDAGGTLVTVDGYQVLSSDGQPITLPDGDVEITTDGKIKVDTKDVATIGLAVFTEPETQLVRDKPNLFSSTGQPTGTEKGTIHQNALESANINIAQLVTQMMSTARSYEASQKLVTVQDSLLGKAISSLGKV